MPKRPYDWRVDTHGCYKCDNTTLGFGPRDQTAHLLVFLHLRTTNLPGPTASCAVNMRNKEGWNADITNTSVCGDDVLDCDVARQSHVSAHLFPSSPTTCESPFVFCPLSFVLCPLSFCPLSFCPSLSLSRSCSCSLPYSALVLFLVLFLFFYVLFRSFPLCSVLFLSFQLVLFRSFRKLFPFHFSFFSFLFRFFSSFFSSVSLFFFFC